MKVSIVIPVFNTKNYLEKCVNSVLSQTYNNIEVILVDDGSTDSSAEICDRFCEKDSRVVVIHKENGGQSEARNIGIDIATGEYITFVDSDDYITKDYIDFLLSLILENDAEISIASFYYVVSNKKINNETNELAVMRPEVAIRRMLLDDGFDMGPWAKMYKTDFFRKIKFPVGKFFEDSLTTYQIFAESNKIAFGSKAIYYYVNHEDSTVNQAFSPKKLDLIEMNKEMEKFISKKYPDLALEAHRRVIWAYFSTLNQVLKSKDLDVKNKYVPELKDKILNEKKFILSNSFVPKRDKIGYILLKLFGVKGYQASWSIYLKIKK